MKQPQLGAGGIFIFVVLLLMMIFIAALFTLSRTSANVDAQKQTAASLANAAAAVEQFAGANARLPCPAQPDLGAGNVNDGVEVFKSPPDSTRCEYPDGVLPWATIGMRRDDAFDAWGWKIFYRVYNGNGGMTQANGASMVNCDTVQALTMRQPVDPTTRLCPAAHDTVDSDFIAGKGLTVTDFGTTYDGASPSGGAAYVLLSPGPSGFGGYTGAGAQNPSSPSSTDEKNNLKATGPFVLEAASAPDVPPNDNSHYDDVLLYRTIADLAKKANLAARDWYDDVLAGVKFDTATVQQYLGANRTGDLLVTSIQFPYATVSGFNSGGSTDLALVTGATPGLGATGGGSNNLDSTGGDGIGIDLAQPAGKLGLTLNNFGYAFNGSPPYWIEQFEMRFYSKGTLKNTVTKQACRQGSVLASYTVNPGVSFDRVEIRSLNTTQSFGFSIPSSFIVSEFATCTSTAPTCRTTLDTANPSSECP